MNKKSTLFDLDGTLTDSGEGIINCAALALKHFGLPVPDRKAMGVFVGPPLRDTFLKFGVRPEQVEEALAVYRSRYTTVGKFENTPYPGIRELLEKLTADGHRLYVATSKPETVSVEILEHFDLSRYFQKIAGATFSKERETKADVIAYLLKKIPAGTPCLMVGDTQFDVLGAAAHGIATVGVSWGYGNTDSLRSAGAAAIADTPEELYRILSA